MIRFLQTPGPIKKYVLSGLLLLITGAMCVYLIPSAGNSSYNFGGTKQGVVAVVGGSDITADEVRQNARQMAQQQARNYGQMASQIMPFLIQQAMMPSAQQLIAHQALVTEAQRMGLRVTPEEIRDEIQHGPAYAATFFPGGTFIGQQEYEDTLQRFGYTVSKFEQGVGDDILVSKLRALISGTAGATDQEIHQEFVKQNTKVKFDYAVLKEDDIKKGLHPTEQELKAYYESHKAAYANSIPEKRKIKYAVIDTNRLEAQVQVSPDDLHGYYEQHRDQYRVPAQIKVSHIWIKMPLPGPDGKVDQNKVAEAQHRAEDISKQLKSGAKFEDLAKKYSEDSGSANVGGSLGWIGQDQMTAEFDKAANALSKGQISEVVKGSDGFHVIRLDDKQEAHTKSIDEVKDQIEPTVKHQKAQQLAQKKAETLLQQARTNGIDAAAAAQSVPVITSDFFSRKDMLPGLGPSPQFMDAVFTAAEKSQPDVATTSQGIAVFQLLGIKPPTTPTFEEIRSRVEDEFKNERGRLLLSQKVQELSDRAKAEHDLKRAAKELGASYKTSDLVLPDGQVPDVGSMSGQASVAFNMKAGEISGPINNGTTSIVLQLTESQPPSDADYTAKRDQIRDTLVQGKQQERFGLFVTNLIDVMTKTGKIKRNEEELKALSRSGTESGM